MRPKSTTGRLSDACFSLICAYALQLVQWFSQSSSLPRPFLCAHAIKLVVGFGRSTAVVHFSSSNPTVSKSMSRCFAFFSGFVVVAAGTLIRLLHIPLIEALLDSSTYDLKLHNIFAAVCHCLEELLLVNDVNVMVRFGIECSLTVVSATKVARDLMLM
jgi:hypothetical protein